MHINKYRNADGDYEINGVICSDVVCVFLNMLGFCCCGQLEEALRHVQKNLRGIKHLREGLSWEDFVAELGGDIGTRQIIWYMLDDKGFTEHGGSVPGWLSPAGEELLEDLDEFFKE